MIEENKIKAYLEDLGYGFACRGPDGFGGYHEEPMAYRVFCRKDQWNWAHEELLEAPIGIPLNALVDQLCDLYSEIHYLRTSTVKNWTYKLIYEDSAELREFLGLVYLKNGGYPFKKHNPYYYLKKVYFEPK